MTCPHCEELRLQVRELEDQLYSAERDWKVQRLAYTLGVTPGQADFLMALYRARRPLTWVEIDERLRPGWPDRSPRGLRVRKFGVNKKHPGAVLMTASHSAEPFASLAPFMRERIAEIEKQNPPDDAVRGVSGRALTVNSPGGVASDV